MRPLIIRRFVKKLKRQIGVCILKESAKYIDHIAEIREEKTILLEVYPTTIFNLFDRQKITGIDLHLQGDIKDEIFS
ncbi:MAG: hypothetical protein C5B52_13835 [Bacteroidetes bacterium]|nr:MAG: hypothetical protein C5B52_13835 [Bacteroidota bacterium]